MKLDDIFAHKLSQGKILRKVNLQRAIIGSQNKQTIIVTSVANFLVFTGP